MREGQILTDKKFSMFQFALQNEIFSILFRFE